MATKSPKMSQDGAQEPQDKPRWRPRAPRGANMSEKGAPTWRYVGQLGAQDGQLGSILGAILAHLGHLEANVN